MPGSCCIRCKSSSENNYSTVESRENNFSEAFTAFNSFEQIDHEYTVHNVKVFSTLSIFSRLYRISMTTNERLTIEKNEFLSEL
ncbi:unnamed protein product [Rotaria sordida]|uniref:Uncharacterized protein n=1 Tax=Rotaria sordida TaxID=392033 RepID=A0A819NEN6_9BILA|nr:unnamed protein product [Rotaria sordida]CAF3994661.1 unnamed protein product [Rotaria sordida]